MSKDDPASGFLSKLVKFVRRPASSWTAHDSVDEDRDESVNKQRLKEAIERKRLNDSVRKREFDMLRKLRKLDVPVGAVDEPGDKPSIFQSSMASQPADRAITRQKIDDLEAQMSGQWGKGKSPASGDNSDQLILMHGVDEDTQQTSPNSLLPVAYQSTTMALKETQTPTLAHAQDSALGGFLYGGPLQPGDSASSDVGGARDTAALVTPLLVSEDELIVHDAELEEVAIVFANGDNAGAEAGLLDILAPDASRANHVQTWLTLFDLYRATGEHDKFEAAAIDFAERFHRSAPQWFCLPDIVKALVKPPESVTDGAIAAWICPSLLKVQSVASLDAALKSAAAPWRLDWTHLKAIDVAAVGPLHKAFGGWASQPVQLRFKGEAQLQKVLLDATPSGNRTTDQKWWLLRMEVLRVLHRADEFELAALDFCVTYEVSPPWWSSAACDYKSLDDEGKPISGATTVDESPSEPVDSRFNLVAMEHYMDAGLGSSWGSPARQAVSVELSGQIRGHSSEVLDRLEKGIAGADKLRIDCAGLIRVDFSAAGMLLNWVSARQAENLSIEFFDVNRLVATFFNVIGIAEYARVRVRID